MKTIFPGAGLLCVARGLGLLLVVAAAGGFGAPAASATVVIAPNTLPDENNPAGPDVAASQAYGDTSNLFPFFPGVGNPLQYQQVYAASQFSTFAPGGEDITEISFRVGIEAPDRTDHGAFAASIPFIQIELSTTANTPQNLSSTFASNLSNPVTVYGTPGAGSPLALASAGAPLTGTAPAPFDVTILLTTDFHYDPAQGNLLLTVINYQGAASPTGVQLDGTSAEDSTARVYDFGSATATTATSSDTEGLVTQFTAVPEPRAGSLLLAAFTVSATLAYASRRPTVPSR